MTVLHGRVLVGGWRGYTDVVACDVTTGEIAWSFPSRNRHLASPVAVGGSLAMLPYPDEGAVAVVRVDDGSVEARVTCPAPGAAFDAAPFVVRQDDGLYCLDEAAQVWRRGLALDDGWTPFVRHERPLLSSAPAPTGRFLALVEERGSLAVYDRETGAQLWDAGVRHRRRDRSPAAALPGGLLAFGSSSGHIYLFNCEGSVAARRHLGNPIEDLVATAGGSLIATTGGRVVSIAVEE